MKPRLAITMGDVNGVGPEILAKALCREALWETCAPLVLGDAGVLETAGAELAGFPTVRTVKTAGDCADESGSVSVLDGGFAAPRRQPGQLDAAAGRCAMEWLHLAVRLAIDAQVAGLVTCPINKAGFHAAGSKHIGHTEAVAELTGSRDYRMCLFADRMRIVHVTAHLPLARAIAQITQENIATSIRVGDDALQRLELTQRRIAVAGLNPHAGESGLLGSEEAEIIGPAVEQCRSEGIDCSGPHPPDTVFRRMHEGEFDLVVAMYHDQGHIPLKLIAMDEGVNVTLGIPIVRTSVDHGTAYDIAGTGTAREDSLIAAVRLAAQLAGYQAGAHV